MAEDNKSVQERTTETGVELTHRAEVEQKGDYLGRKPSQSQRSMPFDEEKLVDEDDGGAPGGETRQSD